MPWVIQTENGIKTVTMADPGPNAMDLEFLSRLLREIQPDADTDGLILTGNGRFFSAGLDIVRLQNAPRGRIKRVITQLNTLLAKIMTISGPVIAIVNGHAVGGGCLLALSCDYRVGVRGNYKMGINEFDLGVPLPPAGLLALRKELSTEQESELTSPGRVYSPEEALAMGFLDELTMKEMAQPKAHQIARRLSSSLRFLWKSKREQVGTELKRLERESHFPETFVDRWMSPGTQEKLRRAVENLINRDSRRS